MSGLALAIFAITLTAWRFVLCFVFAIPRKRGAHHRP